MTRMALFDGVTLATTNTNAVSRGRLGDVVQGHHFQAVMDFATPVQRAQGTPREEAGL